MTEEERHKLCVKLRSLSESSAHPTALDRAADEIERLASLIHDYKLVFGDIHDVKELKERI
jgi:hypothetical protein